MTNPCNALQNWRALGVREAIGPPRSLLQAVALGEPLQEPAFVNFAVPFPTGAAWCISAHGRHTVVEATLKKARATASCTRPDWHHPGYAVAKTTSPARGSLGRRGSFGPIAPEARSPRNSEPDLHCPVWRSVLQVLGGVLAALVRAMQAPTGLPRRHTATMSASATSCDVMLTSIDQHTAPGE